MLFVSPLLYSPFNWIEELVYVSAERMAALVRAQPTFSDEAPARARNRPTFSDEEAASAMPRRGVEIPEEGDNSAFISRGVPCGRQLRGAMKRLYNRNEKTNSQT